MLSRKAALHDFEEHLRSRPRLNRYRDGYRDYLEVSFRLSPTKTMDIRYGIVYDEYVVYIRKADAVRLVMYEDSGQLACKLCTVCVTSWRSDRRTLCTWYSLEKNRSCLRVLQYYST